MLPCQETDKYHWIWSLPWAILLSSIDNWLSIFLFGPCMVDEQTGSWKYNRDGNWNASSLKFLKQGKSSEMKKHTLLSASVKQFFAEGRSPFFQMQLPKHSQASARDGLNFTWNCKREFQKTILSLGKAAHQANRKSGLQFFISYSFWEMIFCFFPIFRKHIQYLSSQIFICCTLHR